MRTFTKCGDYVFRDNPTVCLGIREEEQILKCCVGEGFPYKRCNNYVHVFYKYTKSTSAWPGADWQ